MSVDIVHLCGRHFSVLQSPSDGPGRASAVFIGLHWMVCIRGDAVSRYLGQNPRSPFQGVLLTLKDENSCAFGGDKPVTLGVEGPAGLLRLLVTTGAKGAHHAKAPQAQLTYACLCTSGENNLRPAATDHLRGFPYGLS